MATIRKRGPNQWQASIRRQGHPTQNRTFRIKADAEAWARAIENEMDRGVFLSRAEAESTTFRECIERYVREVSTSKLGYTTEKVRVNTILKYPMVNKFMGQIRSVDIAGYRDVRLGEGKAPSTVVKELALISHMFSVARREWGMESIQNPVLVVSKPRVNNQRDRRLMADEERRLLAACNPGFPHANPWLQPMILLALETAMRKGELLALQWADVNIGRRVLKSKNKDPKGRDLHRTVPLSSKAISVLENLPRSINGVVFPTTDNAIKLAFIRACKRACKHVDDYKSGAARACDCIGIENLRFHDLRHEATSRMFEKGLNPMQVASITGHKTLQMLKRYTHLRAEDLAAMLG